MNRLEMVVCEEKIIFNFLKIIIIICILCACQIPKSNENIKKSSLPKIKIGVDTLKPIFYVSENGTYKGIDAEIAKEACNRAGYKPKYVVINWSERDEYLQDNKVDCLWSGFIKNGREDSYLWTDTYMQSNLRVIVDKKCPDQSYTLLRDVEMLLYVQGQKWKNCF